MTTITSNIRLEAIVSKLKKRVATSAPNSYAHALASRELRGIYRVYNLWENSERTEFDYQMAHLGDGQ